MKLSILVTVVLVGEIYCAVTVRPTRPPPAAKDVSKTLEMSMFRSYGPGQTTYRPPGQPGPDGDETRIASTNQDGCSTSDQTCPTDYFIRLWFDGESAYPADQYSSTINCLYGTYVAGCECSVPHSCHGVSILGSGTGCRVHSNGFSPYEDGAKPMVKCRERIGIEDVKVITTTHADTQLKCPEGYTMDDCYLKDQWSLYSRKMELVRKVYDFGILSCGYQYVPHSGPIPAGSFGKVYAVCVKYEL